MAQDVLEGDRKRGCSSEPRRNVRMLESLQRRTKTCGKFEKVLSRSKAQKNRGEVTSGFTGLEEHQPRIANREYKGRVEQTLVKRMTGPISSSREALSKGTSQEFTNCARGKSQGIYE